jgi:hypothetical protein
MEVSVQLHALGWFTPGSHWNRGRVDPRAGLDAVESRTNCYPCLEKNPCRPVCSLSLYRLSDILALTSRLCLDFRVVCLLHLFRLKCACVAYCREYCVLKTSLRGRYHQTVAQVITPLLESDVVYSVFKTWREPKLLWPSSWIFLP